MTPFPKLDDTTKFMATYFKKTRLKWICYDPLIQTMVLSMEFLPWNPLPPCQPLCRRLGAQRGAAAAAFAAALACGAAGGAGALRGVGVSAAAGGGAVGPKGETKGGWGGNGSEKWRFLGVHQSILVDLPIENLKWWFSIVICKRLPEGRLLEGNDLSSFWKTGCSSKFVLPLQCNKRLYIIFTWPHHSHHSIRVVFNNVLPPIQPRKHIVSNQKSKIHVTNIHTLSIKSQFSIAFCMFTRG